MSDNNLMSAIDRLGVLKAQLAELQREEKELKAIVAEHGVGAYEGEMFRATVSAFDRESLDMDAVREKLSPQFIRAHTRLTPVVQVRVTTRNALSLKIAGFQLKIAAGDQ